MTRQHTGTEIVSIAVPFHIDKRETVVGIVIAPAPFQKNGRMQMTVRCLIIHPDAADQLKTIRLDMAACLDFFTRSLNTEKHIRPVFFRRGQFVAQIADKVASRDNRRQSGQLAFAIRLAQHDSRSTGRNQLVTEVFKHHIVSDSAFLKQRHHFAVICHRPLCAADQNDFVAFRQERNSTFRRHVNRCIVHHNR